MKPSPSMLWGDEGADGMNHVQAMEDEEFRQDVIPPDIALMLEEVHQCFVCPLSVSPLKTDSRC